MEIFRQADVTEIVLPGKQLTRFVWIEIFESVAQANKFRTRIFLQNVFMLFPTFINQDAAAAREGRFVHSDETILTDFTITVADEPDWITGAAASSLDEFRAMVTEKSVAFFLALEEM